jgi:hypothetical protein
MKQVFAMGTTDTAQPINRKMTSHFILFCSQRLGKSSPREDSNLLRDITLPDLPPYRLVTKR